MSAPSTPPPTPPRPSRHAGHDPAARELSAVLESLLLATAKARLALIDTLQALMTSAVDAAEQRRVAATLLRATQAPLIPIRRDKKTGLYAPAGRAEPRNPAPARHRHAPRSSRSPATTGAAVCIPLAVNDATGADSAMPLPAPLAPEARPTDTLGPAALPDVLAGFAPRRPLSNPRAAAWSGHSRTSAHAGVAQSFQDRPHRVTRRTLHVARTRRRVSRDLHAGLFSRINLAGDTS